ncbi:MAG: MATE family efflux transporter [Ruminococcaceae bacterium]|nr:MATE family efflux transporter [Oscillospiraceae bacterium]
MLKRVIGSLVGDRLFYRRVLTLMIPIMIQNGITNLVNMVDNVMVGRIGTQEMSGVAVTNQLLFVFNLCIFGAVSGAGIFTAQFYGNGDDRGIRETFRFKLIATLLLALMGIGLFLWLDDTLIGVYLQGEGTPADIAATLGYAKDYLHIMLIGLVPYALSQCYSSTLRETDSAFLPMIAGAVAVGVNLSLNGVLIFGWLGCPALGVKGAAIATVVSRFVELGIVAGWTAYRRQKHRFVQGAFRSLRVPWPLALKIIRKGFPLMLNETFWAAGLAMLSQCYSLRGLDVVGANNIAQTFQNVFSVAFIAVGVSIGIVLGQQLGAGEEDQAMDSARKLIAFAVVISVGVGALYFGCAYFIPSFYNTTPAIRHLATRLMQIAAVAMPLDAFANAAYFTLRSGGKAFLTFLFDSVFSWGVVVPVVYLLSHYTSVSILVLFAFGHGLSLIKDIVGIILVKKGIWIRNIVNR